jgi:dihydrofolate reductase
MGRVIVIEFVSLDGVVSDPDGSAGTPSGGWAFRHGPESVAGDKFRLGSALDTGVLVLGRTTWELFARIWPSRTDDFAVRMNKAGKVVATRTLTDVSGWTNSAVLDRDLADVVRERSKEQDVVVTGSVSVVRALQAEDLVDQYRLLIFPSVLGEGERLFPAGSPVQHLTCTSAERTGAGVLAYYDRAN